MQQSHSGGDAGEPLCVRRPPGARSENVLAILIAIALVVPWLKGLAWSLAVNADQPWAVSMLLRENAAEFIILAACVAAWFVVRRCNQGRERRLSYLAVSAALLAVLNPAVVDSVLRSARFPVVGRGDSEWRAFRAVLIALGVGVVARVHIGRTGGAVHGRALSTAVIVVGLAGVALAATLVVLFIGAMGGH